MADEARISSFFSIGIHSPLSKVPSFIRVYSRPFAVDQGSLYSCPFAVLFSKQKETKLAKVQASSTVSLHHSSIKIGLWAKQ
jgi:hypothetical protein